MNDLNMLLSCFRTKMSVSNVSFLALKSFIRFSERRIANMTKREFERMASEAQLMADEEAEAALESVDQIEGVLRRPSQIGNQGNTDLSMSHL